VDRDDESIIFAPDGGFADARIFDHNGKLLNIFWVDEDYDKFLYRQKHPSYDKIIRYTEENELDSFVTMNPDPYSGERRSFEFDYDGSGNLIGLSMGDLGATPRPTLIDFLFDKEMHEDITRKGNPIFEPTGGRYGGAYTFDGNDYFELENPLPKENFTVEMWIKTDQNYANPNDADLGLLDAMNGDENKDFDLMIRDGKLRLSIDSTDITGSTIISDGQWHHIAVTVEKDKGTKIYVDGQLEGQNTGKDKFGDGHDRIRLGYSNEGNDDYFKGSIDGFRVLDAVSTQEQILGDLRDPTRIGSDITRGDIVIADLISSERVKNIQTVTFFESELPSGGPTVTGGDGLVGYYEGGEIALEETVVIGQLDYASDDISFFADVQIDPNGGRQNIVSAENGEWEFYYSSGGNLTLRWDRTGGGSKSYSAYDTYAEDVEDTSAMHNIGFILDEDGSPRFYIDGEYVGFYLRSYNGAGGRKQTPGTNVVVGGSVGSPGAIVQDAIMLNGLVQVDGTGYAQTVPLNQYTIENGASSLIREMKIRYGSDEQIERIYLDGEEVFNLGFEMEDLGANYGSDGNLVTGAVFSTTYTDGILSAKNIAYIFDNYSEGANVIENLYEDGVIVGPHAPERAHLA